MKKVVESIANLTNNIKANIVDKVQESGAKMAENILKDLVIKSEGHVEIDIGEIKIEGVNMALNVIDTKTVSKQGTEKTIATIKIPLSIRINPEKIIIPFDIEGALK